jgi:hypothetical protein
MRKQQVHRVRGGDAEPHLVAAHRDRLGRGEQLVLRELLEVPVVVPLLAVEAHRPGPDRPIILPPLQKYWYAFMTGEACDRNPSTSSGPWPPTHTVAAKFR